MDAVELAWLAGLLEGEGSFLAPSPSQPTMPRISVQLCDEDVIARVANCFGVSYWRPDNRNPQKWKQSFKVQIKGNPAVALMRQLYSQMSSRRKEQIDRALRLTEAARADLGLQLANL